MLLFAAYSVDVMHGCLGMAASFSCEMSVFMFQVRRCNGAFLCVHCFCCLRTPFHADVIRSFSWSANVCGRKKWLLVQAGTATS